MLLPNGMDGVGGLTQPHIKPGKTFVYEFELRKSGTFMYHPHADEMVQMAMGMMGFFVVHPRDPELHARRPRLRLPAHRLRHRSRHLCAEGQRDDGLQPVDLEQPRVPGHRPLVVAKGDRVRVRVGNLTMTNHPIHMHGYDFEVTCTDGGWVRPEARWPEVTIDIPVGAMRAFEFVADRARRLGDPLPQVAPHHERHGSRRADLHRRRQARRSRGQIEALVPDYMAMGSAGMADMGEMEMPLPDNTLPMMTGFGQFGPIEMGGMFSVVKVREGLAPDDYKDPGWYKHPPGTVACEWKGRAANDARAPAPVPASKAKPAGKVDAVKPNGQP